MAKKDYEQELKSSSAVTDKDEAPVDKEKEKAEKAPKRKHEDDEDTDSESFESDSDEEEDEAKKTEGASGDAAAKAPAKKKVKYVPVKNKDGTPKLDEKGEQVMRTVKIKSADEKLADGEYPFMRVMKKLRDAYDTVDTQRRAARNGGRSSYVATRQQKLLFGMCQQFEEEFKELYSHRDGKMPKLMFGGQLTLE